MPFFDLSGMLRIYLIVIFAVFLSGIFTTAVYIIGRTFYWGCLTTSIIHVKNQKGNNLLEQFLLASRNSVHQKHKYLKHFSNAF